MRYAFGVMWLTVLAGCVFSLCDVPVALCFDSPFFSSPYTQVLEQTMRVWSDIRVVAGMLNDLHDQGDMNTFVYAIIGQLLCVEHALIACDAKISSEDIVYLARVLAIIQQEATALPLVPMHAVVMQQLFSRIEKKLTALLS